MPRRKQFTVDAEKVQGNAGATVTFRSVTVGANQDWLDDDNKNNRTLLEQYIISWAGIVDDNDKELPSPADDPAVLGALYLHEQREMARLLFQGPYGDSAKN